MKEFKHLEDQKDTIREEATKIMLSMLTHRIKKYPDITSISMITMKAEGEDEGDRSTYWVNPEDIEKHGLEYAERYSGFIPDDIIDLICYVEETFDENFAYLTYYRDEGWIAH